MKSPNAVEQGGESGLPLTPGATRGKHWLAFAGVYLFTLMLYARPGDVIKLQAGATFTGNFRLPNKSGSDWIVVRSSAADADLPPAGTRITPAKSAIMPKLISPNSSPVAYTDEGAHHYRFIGVEFGVAAGKDIYNLVAFGADQTSLAQSPHDLIIDRCYIHGNDAGAVQRGVRLNCARAAVIDSYISNCHGEGFDTQAICGWNGSGPFKIVNNYLEGAGWVVDPKDDAGVLGAVRERYRQWKAGECGPAADPEIVARFDRRKLAGRLAELFDRLNGAPEIDLPEIDLPEIDLEEVQMANEKLTGSSVIDAPSPPLPVAWRPSARDVTADGGGVSVVVINDLIALEKYVLAWEDLAANAIEPNAFYEPWMLMPAIRAFGAGRNLQFALVLANEPARHDGAPLLCGIFPLERQNHFQGLSRKLPFKTLRLWKHKYCYLCTPLVREGYGRQVIAAFFDWLDAGSHDCSLMEFRFIAGDGLFNGLLIDYFERHAKLHYISMYFLRAMFRPTIDADTYLCAALSAKHRKMIRRQERQLSEIGRLEYDALTPDDDVVVWIEEFLRLEASGWKGLEKTAIASDESDQSYFRSIAKQAFRRGRLSMQALRLDGRPIAYKCDFPTGRGLFTFRIAFDENYARNSPGMLLEIENVRRLHARSQIDWVDSCNDSFSSMFNRLWPARRTILDVVVGAGKTRGDWVVAAIPLLKLLNRKLLRRGAFPQ